MIVRQGQQEGFEYGMNPYRGLDGPDHEDTEGYIVDVASLMEFNGGTPSLAFSSDLDHAYPGGYAGGY